MQATAVLDPTAPKLSGRIDLSIPRKRALLSRDLIHVVPDTTEEQRGMLYWVAEAAKEARIDAGRLQVHIAAELSKNQSTIDRFESHGSQPREVDATVQAYADDLEIDVRQLWARALEMWIASEKPEAEHAATATRAVQAASKSAQTRTSKRRRAKGQ